MKNITVFGKEYEVRGQSGCTGCLFDPPGMRPACDEAPCVSSSGGNEGRGPFIVIKEVPMDTPTPHTPPPVIASGGSVPPADWGDTKVEVLAPGQPFGRKDDSSKLDMTLLDDMPRAIKAVVEVMQWAVTDKKPVPYERGSWLGVHADRYRAAISRHGRDAAQQASTQMPGDATPLPARLQRDKETDLLHLAHIATSALMALENVLREQEAQRG